MQVSCQIAGGPQSPWNKSLVRKTCLGLPYEMTVRTVSDAEQAFFDRTYRRYVPIGTAVRFIGVACLLVFLATLVSIPLGFRLPDPLPLGILAFIPAMGTAMIGVHYWPHDRRLRQDRKSSSFEIYSNGNGRIVRCAYSGLILSTNGNVSTNFEFAPAIVDGVATADDRYPCQVRSLEVPEDAIRLREMAPAEVYQVKGLIRCGLSMWVVLLTVLAALTTLGFSEMALYNTGFSFALPVILALWMAINLRRQYWEAYSILSLMQDARAGKVAMLVITDEAVSAQIEVMPHSHYVWSVNSLPAPWRSLRGYHLAID